MPTPLRPADALSLLDLGRRDEALTAARDGIGAAALPDELRAWCHVAEAAGHGLLALTGWRALLRMRPGDAEAAAAVDELGASRAGPPAPPEPPAAEPSSADLLRFVHRFGGREGVHARMWSRGSEIGYSPVQVGLDEGLARAHVRGELTVGSYVVHRDDTVSFGVFDLDITKAALDQAWGDPAAVAGLRAAVHGAALQLRAHLRAQGLDPLLVDSGFKGRHLWLCLDRRAPAARCRAWLAELRAGAPALDPRLAVDVFPRQDRVPPGGLGNLVKLPLGVHLRTGRRAELLGEDGRPEADPWARLAALRPATVDPAPRPAAPPAPERPSAPAPAPAPRFTAGDLDARPRLAAVLGGCAVLRRVVDGVLAGGPLSRDAAVVLEHSLGHLPEGVEAVNWLAERAGQPAPMGRPHAGSPVSCARIRKRLPADAAAVPCACRFSRPGSYEHPVLHADGVPAEPPRPADPPLEQQLRALDSLEGRLAAVLAERDALRRAVVDRLRALPAAGLVVDGQRWWAEDHEGLPALRRAPADDAPAAP